MSKLDHGPEWFQKMFAKASLQDDWGVPSVDGYAAWRLAKAAIRHERKRLVVREQKNK